MSIDFEEELRELMDRSASTIDVRDAPLAAQVAQRGARRNRRRQLVGGLATMLVVAALTIGVGLGLREDPSRQVFADGSQGPADPGTVVFDGDRYVGISPTGPFEFDGHKNADGAMVVSADGLSWQWLPDSPVFSAVSSQLRLHNGVFHVVTVQSVHDEAADSAEETYELVHTTTTDLRVWAEHRHPLPAEIAGGGDFLATLGLAFVDDGPVVQLISFPDPALDPQIAALGLEAEEICEVSAYESIVSVRKCGDPGTTYLRRAEPVPQTVQETIILLADGVLRPVEVPDSDNESTSLLGQRQGPGVLYQTGDGVGLSSRSVFESSNGLDWSEVDMGLEQSPLLAVRGQERVFRSWRDIQRFGSDDPIKGMGYSADGGETWIDVRLNEVLPGSLFGGAHFRDLTAFDDGWLMLAHRPVVNKAQVEGVELQSRFGSAMDYVSSSPIDFTVAVGDYVLDGRSPFGPAELRGPSGQVMRSWDQLELENPVWSGLDIVDDGIAVAAVEGGPPVMTISFEQWRSIRSADGFNSSELVYSPDGINWSVVDSSDALWRLLAVGDGEVVLQRFEAGIHSRVPHAVEVVQLPSPDDAEAE